MSRPVEHRQPAALRLEDGVDVRVEVVGTALQHPGDLPEVLALAEVVDVVAEPDLVDPGPAGLLDVVLSAVGRVGPKRRVVGPAQMRVVIDDHEGASQHSTSAKSSALVTFSRRGSPATTFTRPPRASTSDAQSLASDASPANASRKTDAMNACGV